MSLPVGGGTLVTLASATANGLNAIAVDATSVYWGDADLAKVPIGGGAVTTLVPGVTAAGIAVDSTNVYWTTNSGGDFGPGQVMKVALNGGTATTLASTQTDSALAIAVDFQNVYWTEGDAVLKVPSAGGAVTTLTAGAALPVSIAVDATSVYWGTNSYPMEPDFGAIVKLTPK